MSSFPGFRGGCSAFSNITVCCFFCSCCCAARCSASRGSSLGGRFAMMRGGSAGACYALAGFGGGFCLQNHLDVRGRLGVEVGLELAEGHGHVVEGDEERGRPGGGEEREGVDE